MSSCPLRKEKKKKQKPQTQDKMLSIPTYRKNDKTTQISHHTVRMANNLCIPPKTVIKFQVNYSLWHSQTRSISPENHLSERHMHPSVHCSTAHSSRDTEPQDVTRSLIMKLCDWSSQRWTLEDHTLSEVSQTKEENTRWRIPGQRKKNIKKKKKGTNSQLKRSLWEFKHKGFFFLS